MKALLKEKGLYRIVFDKGSIPEKTTPYELSELEMRAHSSILLCLADEVCSQVIQEDTAEKLWKKLESIYLTKSLESRVYLIQQMFLLKMEKGTSLEDHLRVLNNLVMDLYAVDEKVTGEYQAIALLSSLPPEYANFVETMVSGKAKISLEEVKAALITREIRRKVSGQDTGDAPKAEVLYGGRKEKRSKGGSGKGSDDNKACFHCKKQGHFKRDCPELKAKEEVKGKELVQAGIAFDGSDDDGNLLAASLEGGKQSSWILDSGCDSHMTPLRSHFSSYTPMDGPRIFMGNGGMSKVVGSGMVKLRKMDGSACTLANVRHVPDLTKSLISLGALTGRGCRVVLERERLQVSRKGKVVMQGRKRGNLYELQGQAWSSWVETQGKAEDRKLGKLLGGTAAVCSGDVSGVQRGGHGVGHSTSHPVATQEGLAIRVERSHRQHVRGGSKLAEGIMSSASTRVCGANGEEMVWSSGTYKSMGAVGLKTYWREKSKGKVELRESTRATTSQGDVGSQGSRIDTGLVLGKIEQGEGGRGVNS